MLTGAIAAAGLAALPACGSRFAGARLRIATGGTAGEYYRLGRALAAVWQERLGLTATPEVLATNGSPANVSLLVTGAAEVAISQLDVAADRTVMLIVHRLLGVERLDRIWRLSGGRAIAATS